MGLNKAALILALLIGATVDPARAAFVLDLTQQGATSSAPGAERST
jgi:hypothetical protein